MRSTHTFSRARLLMELKHDGRSERGVAAGVVGMALHGEQLRRQRQTALCGCVCHREWCVRAQVQCVHLQMTREGRDEVCSHTPQHGAVLKNYRLSPSWSSSERRSQHRHHGGGDGSDGVAATLHVGAAL